MMLNSIDTEYEQIIMTNNTEQELIRFMTDWGNLSGRRDTAGLAQILPDDLIQTRHDGRVLTKTEYLEGLKNFPADFCITDYDQQAQIFDQTAIVRATYKLEMNGNAMHLRYTATFIKRAGKWQPIALHSSTFQMN
jgi:hypothetical protein